MAGIKVYVYDPADIILLIGGVPITSFGSGDAVTLSRDGNINDKQVGLVGDVTVNYKRDKTGTLTVNLKAHSVEDKLLDELQALGDLPAFPVKLIEKSTNKQLFTQGWLEEQPDLVFGEEVADRAHVIGLANAIPSAIEGAFNAVGAVQSI